jgi:hypothetical protein
VEHSALIALAGTQAGLFTVRQARACGYSSFQIRARLDDGRWRRVLGPVLGGPGAELAPAVRDRAALLAAGAKAVLSGPSAARLHGMEVTADFACVTVPAERHLALPGVRLLREAAGPPDCTTIDDLPATTRPRTVFDRLRVLPRRDAATLLDRALQQQWITKDDLIERVAARRRHRDVRGCASWSTVCGSAPGRRRNGC